MSTSELVRRVRRAIPMHSSAQADLTSLVEQDQALRQSIRDYQDHLTAAEGHITRLQEQLEAVEELRLHEAEQRDKNFAKVDRLLHAIRAACRALERADFVGSAREILEDTLAEESNPASSRVGAGVEPKSQSLEGSDAELARGEPRQTRSETADNPAKEPE